jgi:tetratricopeptide (TPR) repeat protein
VLANARYAFMLAKQGRMADARKHLQELPAENQGQRVQILQTEAQLLRENKEYQESFDILQKALDSQPDHPELLYDVALAAEKLNRIDVAESSLRKLITLKPDHAQAYNALGYTLADRTNRLAEAREYIEKGESEGKTLLDAIHDGELDGMQDFDSVIRKLIEAGTISLEDGMSYATNQNNLLLQLKGLSSNEDYLSNGMKPKMQAGDPIVPQAMPKQPASVLDMIE